MSFNHVAVWVDHAEAHIVQFNRESSEVAIVKSHTMHPNIHTNSGGSGKFPEDAAYLNGIATAVKDAQEILIVGPGLEKNALMTELSKHHRDIAEKVVGVETVDHPSDKQLLAFAKKYFVAVDRML